MDGIYETRKATSPTNGEPTMELDEQIFKHVIKYRNKSLQALIRLCDGYFNSFIRTRDKNKLCLCCGRAKIEHACHFKSAGVYKSLRWNEINVNGGCAQNNIWKGGNLDSYRVGLIGRYGEEAVLELDRLASEEKKNGFHLDRLKIIETIITYRNKLKPN